jgi:isoleucyl-tRNA synthetase
LEARINKARLIVSLGLSLRKKEQIKVRQPLQKLMIPVKNKEDRAQLASITDQIKNEINVKELELLDDASAILVKEIKPNFKTLGPRFGKEMRFVAETIKQLSEDEIRQLENQGKLDVIVNEKNITLEKSDVEVNTKDIEGWLIASGSGTTVALDITLNETLIEEGISRELVNRIQNLRKDAGLEVTDKIAVQIAQHAGLEKAVGNNKSYIMSETLTEALDFVAQLPNGQALTFDEIDTQITIKKL